MGDDGSKVAPGRWFPSRHMQLQNAKGGSFLEDPAPFGRGKLLRGLLKFGGIGTIWAAQRTAVRKLRQKPERRIGRRGHRRSPSPVTIRHRRARAAAKQHGPPLRQKASDLSALVAVDFHSQANFNNPRLVPGHFCILHGCQVRCPGMMNFGADLAEVNDAVQLSG
jgi:hypothetical protein